MDDMIRAACKIEGCKPKDLLYSRVREDGRVVLIIGPAGRKRIVDVPGGDVAEPPVTTTDVGPAPVFAELMARRVLVILAQHGLDDPEVLRGMTNSELEAVPGIGRAMVREIRGVLDRVG